MVTDERDSAVLQQAADSSQTAALKLPKFAQRLLRFTDIDDDLSDWLQDLISKSQLLANQLGQLLKQPAKTAQTDLPTAIDMLEVHLNAATDLLARDEPELAQVAANLRESIPQLRQLVSRTRTMDDTGTLVVGSARIPVRAIQPSVLEQLTDNELLELDRRHQQAFLAKFVGHVRQAANDLSREEVASAQMFVLTEMARRHLPIDPSAPLSAAARSLEAAAARKAELAAVRPSGRDPGPPIARRAVLKHVGSFLIRRPCVFLVGGLAQHESTEGDIDILIRGPLDPRMRRSIEARIEQMMPKELAQRLHFLDDDIGPLGPHIPLADLTLQASGSFERKQMRYPVVREDDPLLDLPETPGKRRAVVQYHFRGQTLHVDLRMQIDDWLVGWTLLAQRPSTVRSPVTTVAQAKKLARTLSRDGDRILKPIKLPGRVAATPKSRQPLAWLNVLSMVADEGEVGATVNEKGIFWAVATPSVEYGIQSPVFHEYFFSEDDVLHGRFVVRLLPQGDSDEPRWVAFFTTSQLPSVLQPRALESGTMPPTGFSALPVNLEELVPAEFRYWELGAVEAQKTRDRLIQSKLFTDDNVRIVNSVIRRVTKRLFLSHRDELSRGYSTRRFTLSQQTSHGHGSDDGQPTGQAFYLFVDRPGIGLDSWILQTDPRFCKQALVGVFRDHQEKQLLEHEDEILTGVCTQNTDDPHAKKTLSPELRIRDTGKANVLESRDQVRRVRFDGERLRGTYIFEQEDPTLAVWTIARVDENDEHGEITGVAEEPSTFKGMRVLKAIILERDPTAEHQNPLAFVAGIGPVASGSEADFKVTREHREKVYVVISGVIQTRFSVSVGDVVAVQIDKMSIDLRDGQKSMRWASPTVVEILRDTYPDTFDDVVAIARPHEVTNIFHRYIEPDQAIIEKKDDERFTLGVVLEPGIKDAQNDMYSADEVRRACHRFAEYFGNAGLMHQEIANGRIVIVENYISPCTFTADNGELVRKGSWLQGRKYNDETIWKKIKDGELTGLSIGGSAIRKPPKG